MIRSEEHKFIYVAVPKTASTSIYSMLAKDYGARLCRATTGDRTGYHDPRTLDDHYCFTSVRNPFSRMVSLWSSISRSYDLPYWKKHWRTDFATFVDRLLSDKRIERYWLVSTQSEFLRTSLLDQVLKFEDLPDNLRSLPFVHHCIQLPHHHHGEYGKDWKAFFTPRLERRIAEWSAEDFQRFAYSMTL